MYARYLAGGTVGEGFESIGERALETARRGLALADRSHLLALRGR